MAYESEMELGRSHPEAESVRHMRGLWRMPVQFHTQFHLTTTRDGRRIRLPKPINLFNFAEKDGFPGGAWHFVELPDPYTREPYIHAIPTNFESFNRTVSQLLWQK
jgi:hypothetical protein